MPTVPKAIVNKDPIEAVHEWFRRLERYCNAVDFASPRSIYRDDVVSFGSEEKIGSELAVVRENMIWASFAKLVDQWNHVWPSIHDFKIDMDSVRAGGNYLLAWGAAIWTSTGFDETGTPFERPGRISLVLGKRGPAWYAIHTHNSLAPGIPANTYAPAKNAS